MVEVADLLTVIEAKPRGVKRKRPRRIEALARGLTVEAAVCYPQRIQMKNAACALAYAVARPSRVMTGPAHAVVCPGGWWYWRSAEEASALV